MADLYSEVLLDHFRHPRNFGSLPAPDIVYEDVNPLCGDRIRFELTLRDNVVAAARFRGDGCAICMAAASLLTELAIGSDIDQGDVVANETLLSSLQSDIKPSRLQCVFLPLEVLRSGVKIYRRTQALR
jgi:nitrogen fixation NifU-like protein